MAQLNFIKGSIKGRVGQFVGSSWRGKDYIKTFTKPGNPNTEGQRGVRTIFQHAAHIAKGIYEGVLKPYTFPRPQKYTAYNRMIQINKALFETLTWEPPKLKIFEGPLFNPGIASAAVEGSGENALVRVTFTTTTGDGTDKAAAVIYDDKTDTTVYGVGERTAGEITVSIATIDQADLSGLHAYLVFAKPPAEGTAETGEVSGTAYLKVPTP